MLRRCMKLKKRFAALIHVIAFMHQLMHEGDYMNESCKLYVMRSRKLSLNSIKYINLVFNSTSNVPFSVLHFVESPIKTDSSRDKPHFNAVKNDTMKRKSNAITWKWKCLKMKMFTFRLVWLITSLRFSSCFHHCTL